MMHRSAAALLAGTTIKHIFHECHEFVEPFITNITIETTRTALSLTTLRELVLSLATLHHSIGSGVQQVQKEFLLTPQLVKALKNKRGELKLCNFATLLKQKVSFMSRLQRF